MRRRLRAWFTGWGDVKRFKAFAVKVYTRARPGKPISRKVLIQFLTAVGVYAVAFTLARLEIHLDPGVAGIVSGAVAAVAGLVAGWLKRELPEIVNDNEPG